MKKSINSLVLMTLALCMISCAPKKEAAGVPDSAAPVDAHASETGEKADSAARIANVKPDVPTADGGLEKSIVQNVVRDHQGEIRSCYERALSGKPDISGRLTVVWTITSQGKVSEPSVKDSKLADESLENCIVDAVKSWEFPAPEGGGQVSVEFPFEFSVDTGAP